MFSIHDMNVEIFSWLSVQDLQKVRAVCKEWHALAEISFWKTQCHRNWESAEPCNGSWKARFKTYRNWENGNCFIETYPNFLPKPQVNSKWRYNAKLFHDHITQIFWDAKYIDHPPVIYLNHWPHQEIIEIKRKGSICRIALNIDFLAILNNSKNVEIYDKTTGGLKRIIKSHEF